MKKVYKGFWEIAKQSKVPVTEYLKAYEVDGGFFGYDFLHGFCTMLALKLHELYGYGICICISKESEYIQDSIMIHTYCKYGNWYLDARGCTNDKEKFFEEFGGIDKLDIDIAIPAPNLEECSFYEKLTYEMTESIIQMCNSFKYPLTTDIVLPQITTDCMNEDEIACLYEAEEQLKLEYELKGEWHECR